MATPVATMNGDAMDVGMAGVQSTSASPLLHPRRCTRADAVLDGGGDCCESVAIES